MRSVQSKTSKRRPASGQTMKSRPPPPSYDETVVRSSGELGRRFATTGGHSSNGMTPASGVSAAVDYRPRRSNAPPGRRSNGVGESAALAMAKLLRSSGTKVRQRSRSSLNVRFYFPISWS